MLCFALALLLLLPLSADVAAQSATEDAELAAPEQTVEVDPKASDTRIGQRVQSIFEATGWFADPRVSVRDGVVFLDGVTETAERKKWARDLAARTDGVVAVVNNIRVEQTVSWSLEPARAELQRIAEQAIAAAPLLLLSLLILPLAWFLARLVARLTRYLLGGRVDSVFLRDIIARAVALPVFLLGIYLVLQIAGLTQLALSIVGGAGVMGIVIGFAFRDIAENFLASLLLSIRRPFGRGDLIRVGDKEGIVQSMNTRSTVLISVEGNHIQIPNAVVFKETIENFTAVAKRRGDFTVGIGYDASIAETQEVLSELLKSNEAIFADPAPMVLVEALGASTVNIKAYYWFDGWKYSPQKLKSALLRQSKKVLTDAGISMPDEAREVIFPEGIPLVKEPDAGDHIISTPQMDEITASPESSEPAFSASDADLASETEDLQQQSTAHVEEGETDLLADTGSSAGDARKD